MVLLSELSWSCTVGDHKRGGQVQDWWKMYLLWRELHMKKQRAKRTEARSSVTRVPRSFRRKKTDINCGNHRVRNTNTAPDPPTLYRFIVSPGYTQVVPVWTFSSHCMWRCVVATVNMMHLFCRPVSRLARFTAGLVKVFEMFKRPTIKCTKPGFSTFSWRFPWSEYPTHTSQWTTPPVGLVTVAWWSFTLGHTWRAPHQERKSRSRCWWIPPAAAKRLLSHEHRQRVKRRPAKCLMTRFCFFFWPEHVHLQLLTQLWSPLFTLVFTSFDEWRANDRLIDKLFADIVEIIPLCLATLQVLRRLWLLLLLLRSAVDPFWQPNVRGIFSGERTNMGVFCTLRRNPTS